jgi:hypothetical protein
MTLAELESMQFVLQEGFAAIDSSPYVVQQRASIIKAVADAIEQAKVVRKTATPEINFVVSEQVPRDGSKS